MAETYGIGGTEVKSDANEAFADIPQNRTLMVEKLTADPPVKPEILTGLKTIEEVFDHFQPEVGLEFDDAEGVEVKESLKFSNLGDFGAKGITRQSKFLQDLDIEKDQCVKIAKQLKTNKILKSAIADPEAKQSILDAIRALLSELEDKK
jgi:hypothetical protein